MKIYKCSWPNGTFSIVHAKDKFDAICILDEWGPAERSMLKELKEFAMDFNFNPEAVAEGVKVDEAIAEDDYLSEHFDRTRLYRWHMSERTDDAVELLSPQEVADEIAKTERSIQEQRAENQRERSERESAAAATEDPALD